MEAVVGEPIYKRYPVPSGYEKFVGKMSAMAIMLLSDTNSLSFVKPVRRSFV